MSPMNYRTVLCSIAMLLIHLQCAAQIELGIGLGGSRVAGGCDPGRAPQGPASAYEVTRCSGLSPVLRLHAQYMSDADLGFQAFLLGPIVRRSTVTNDLLGVAGGLGPLDTKSSNTSASLQIRKRYMFATEYSVTLGLGWAWSEASMNSTYRARPNLNFLEGRKTTRRNDGLAGSFEISRRVSLATSAFIGLDSLPTAIRTGWPGFNLEEENSYVRAIGISIGMRYSF